MSFSDMMQLAQTVLIALAGGLALLQLRHSQQSRDREAALQLLRSFQTPEFARGMQLVFEMPDGLDKAALEAYVGDRMGELYTVLTTLESIGILLHRRELSIDMVDDFFSGVIVLAGRRCARYFEEVRRETGRQTIGEWVQWLAEQFIAREGQRAVVPAHIAYRDWRPPRR
jgi:hypothetical protein